MFKLNIEEAQIVLDWYNSYYDRNEPTKKDKNLVKAIETFLCYDTTKEIKEEEE